MKGANIVFNRDVHPHRIRTKKSKASSTTEVDGAVPLQCALYDLQYVGLGLPTLDLVYFLGTSVESKLLKSLADERELLQDYFQELQRAAEADASEYTFDKFWMHWELAIVDWCRFMAGWGFWGNDRWVERRAKEIVARWNKDGFPV